VGSNKESSFDSRIISATNQNLRDSMFQNRFRLDLFHRLNTIEIVIPPLRERNEDIAPIWQHYMDSYALMLKKPKPFVDSSVYEILKQYTFPGNVRELKNIVERMYILGNHLHWDANLLLKINPYLAESNDKQATKTICEEDEILQALLRAKGKQKEAALLLNMSEATLYRRIVKYGLQKHTRKGS
jgi:DNA-binding NtrC family response regulator